MKAISSAANPRFKQWQKLATQPRAVRQLGSTLAEGLHLAQAALDAKVEAEAALVRQGAALDLLHPILDQMNAPVYELSAALYDALAPVEHGVGLMLVLPVLPALLPTHLDADLVYLDGVQDPGNAGALLRVAAAADAAYVCASPTTTALWAPKVLRGAQGAHFGLRVIEQVTPEQLRGVPGVTWIGAAAHQAQALWRATLPSTPIGWMFGSEGQGLCAEAEALCALRVSIPVNAAVESLNVATSAAVCLFERKRRREMMAFNDGVLKAPL